MLGAPARRDERLAGTCHPTPMSVRRMTAQGDSKSSVDFRLGPRLAAVPFGLSPVEAEIGYQFVHRIADM
jgi:hypothetical protein